MSSAEGRIDAASMAEPSARDLRLVVTASAAGTAFEWYDFFIFGALTSVIGKQFFTGVDEAAATVFALLVFAAGFAVRPLGALVFGHFGDRLGRKNAFIVTITLMGVATSAIGLLPTFSQVGLWAPIALVTLRCAQGFALGGEYGGAAIYVAEHAPAGKRGFYTSWVQTSAAFGLVSALLVILTTRTVVGEEAFAAWGWRIPFIVSIFLFLISLWIRVSLGESPAFQRIKEAGGLSHAPLAESFFKWRNLKLVLLALGSLMAAQGAIWYAVHFYAQVFLERILKVPPATVNGLFIASVSVSAVLYVFFGWLSDKIGRKKIMVSGIGLAALTLFPGFEAMTRAANPDLAAATSAHPAIVVADPSTCSFQFDVIGRANYVTACDIAKATLAAAGVSYRNEPGPPGAPALVRIGATEVASTDASGRSPEEQKRLRAEVQGRIKAALNAAGYPEKADPAKIDKIGVLAVLVWFVVCATALFGPLAACLVELFPTRIRYSALSLPYHIGTGWFGGFMPVTAFAIVVATGNIFAGLWYPVVVGAVSVMIALIFLPETLGRDIHS